jgi:hypothetical protein
MPSFFATSQFAVLRLHAAGQYDGLASRQQSRRTASLGASWPTSMILAAPLLEKLFSSERW